MNLSSFKKPSRYINNEINTIHKAAPVKIALVFPDIYEIGMSHLGLKILYKIINDFPYAAAERVFSPWIDLEAWMKAYGIPLSSLESNRPLSAFDIVGFSLQYELSYTTVLNMLHLGGIPVKSEDRNLSSLNHLYPIIIAGGPCTVNPLPMSAFIDAFLIGDGEEAVKEIIETFYSWKTEGDGKRESVLLALSEIEGMYVPSVQSSIITPPYPPFSKGGNGVVKRRIIKSLDNASYPDKPIVPYTSIVHDRVNIEVARGCSMGCRFCQAGMIYRPAREKSPERVLDLAEKSLKATGYEEVAFTSLSTGDYSCLLQVVREFNKRFERDKIALSLPSLRVASVNRDILKEIRAVRKTGFTIAPEAGTGRLRRVINKDFSEEDYEQALRILFEEGWHNLKLYFMIGLPTETGEDIEAIPEMAMKALKTAKRFTKRFVNLSVGISPFVPKSHTPFQWYGQEPADELRRKKIYIKNFLSKKGFNIKGHDVEMSLLEAAFSRGDERLAPLIEKAWSLGCRLDGWTETFDFEKWKKAMEHTGMDVTDFAEKTFQFSDVLPWERVDIGVTKEFLWKEYNNALSESITIDCRKECHNCGIECHKNTEKGRYGEGEKIRKFEDINLSPNLRVAVSPLYSQTQFKPVSIRVEFSKTERLRYLSHLELVNVIHRAMRRAGFPLKYSKGFHPGPKVSFGPPLSVGVAGLNEYFDMEIIPPFDLLENRRQLNNVLPEGIYVNYMAVIPANAESLNSFITRYEYEVRGGEPSNIKFFLSEKEIKFHREKHFVNLRSFVEEAVIVEENTVKVILVDQGNIKVRLGEILPLLLDAPLEGLDVTRIALYGWKGGWASPINKYKVQIVDYKI
ncbi:MAG: TIGR03960 family B12-binding radical SAM protein [Nitrospirae bacterium]|nr:TIGR03960 family B12-binding radical SAM protein [Nitrospirota bacterium]